MICWGMLRDFTILLASEFCVESLELKPSVLFHGLNALLLKIFSFQGICDRFPNLILFLSLLGEKNPSNCPLFTPSISLEVLKIRFWWRIAISWKYFILEANPSLGLLESSSVLLSLELISIFDFLLSKTFCLKSLIFLTQLEGENILALLRTCCLKESSL